MSYGSCNLTADEALERLREGNRSLWQEVKKILEQNKAERHIRGGNATREKYEKRRAAAPSAPEKQHL